MLAASVISNILPYLILGAHIVLGLAVLTMLFKVERATSWVSRHALTLGLLMAIAAVTGSLFYSNGMDFAPCDLCWWQRIFIYPALPMFAVAVWKRDYHVFRFMVPLSIIGAIISLYHLFVQMGGNSILPCSASASCDKLYVYEFGYVTIPTMALTVSIAFLILAWIRKRHE